LESVANRTPPAMTGYFHKYTYFEALALELSLASPPKPSSAALSTSIARQWRHPALATSPTSNERLVKYFAKYGYLPTMHIVGLWRHITPPIQFVSSSTVVDDFAVNTFGRQHAEHSVNALADLYQIASD
jgi:hypothetical protein